MNDGRELKYRIEKVDVDSDRKSCRTVCQSVSDRLDARCNVDGGNFEHLRD